MKGPESTAEGAGSGPCVWCVVVAAGSGSRFGGPKQFAPLGGARVLDRSVSVAAACCEGVVVVLAAELLGSQEAEVVGADVVVAGGASRSASSRAGVQAVPEEATVILVHDAARPLADVALFERVIGAVRGGADGAVPVVAMADTVRNLEGDLVDRDSLVAVQTPQGFAASVLRKAVSTGAEATDDAALVEAAGGAVVFVEGDPLNRKLTTPDDLVVAEALLSDAAARSSELRS